MFGEIETEVAPLTVQLSTEQPPALMEEGEAENELITGGGAVRETVMESFFVTLPEVFVAVSV
jgi:hypothetical protein